MHACIHTEAASLPLCFFSTIYFVFLLSNVPVASPPSYSAVVTSSESFQFSALVKAETVSEVDGSGVFGWPYKPWGLF